MPHDVLISYSSKDKPKADAICNRLESRGIRCWIAPRDVPLGTEYAESIVQAIEEAKAMVLVFSANADRSHQVRREVERAVSKGVTIVPVRIEDAEMSKSIELYVSSMHWLDAITPPLEEHIDKLADGLAALIAQKDGAKVESPPAPAAAAAAEAPGPAPAAPPEPAPKAAAAASPGKKFGVIGVALAVILGAALAYVWQTSGPDGGGGRTPAEESAATAERSVERDAAEDVGQPPAPTTTTPTQTTTPAPATTSDEARLTFSNAAAVPVEVYWLDFDGREQLYATVAPGQRYTQDTYLGHRWIVRLQEDAGGRQIETCEAVRAEGECIADVLTGWDLSHAEFVGPTGELQGAFRQSGPATWVEEGADGGVRFRFEETARDVWSVYLHDASRTVDIQLDLWTREIRYSDANNEQFVLTSIARASR